MTPLKERYCLQPGCENKVRGEHEYFCPTHNAPLARELEQKAAGK